MSLFEMPDVDLYRRFEDAGVTDLICAPWMMVPKDVAPADRPRRRREELERFAEQILAPINR